MIQSVSTTNLLEVALLLGRYHRITSVEVKPGRFGVNELEVTLEGDNIQLDRGTSRRVFRPREKVSSRL